MAEVFARPAHPCAAGPCGLLGPDEPEGQGSAGRLAGRALGEKAGAAQLRSRVLLLRLEDPIAVAVDAVGTLSRPGDRAAMQSNAVGPV